MFTTLNSFNKKTLLPYTAIIITAFAMSHFCVKGQAGEISDMHRTIVAFIGLIANVRVIHFHLTTPPHPKFLKTKLQKIMIGLHAGLGILEILVGCLALFWPVYPVGLLLASIAVLHALTALAHTPSVFGAKAIMIPCYFMAGSLHLYMGYRLFLEPSSPFWIMNTFLTINIYAYVRMFIVFFQRKHIFRDNLYSASVVAAGFVVLPTVMGSAAPVYMLIQILAFVVMAKFILNFSKRDIALLWKENARIVEENSQLQSAERETIQHNAVAHA